MRIHPRHDDMFHKMYFFRLGCTFICNISISKKKTSIYAMNQLEARHTYSERGLLMQIMNCEYKMASKDFEAEHVQLN